MKGFVSVVVAVVIAVFFSLLYPAGWVKILKRDRPELNEDDPRLFITIRLIGVACLIVALFLVWRNYQP